MILWVGAENPPGPVQSYVVIPAVAAHVVVLPAQIVSTTPVMEQMGNAFTITANVVVVAHCPAAGVNVYIVVAVLFKAGNQLPVIGIAFVDDVGNGDNTAPEHIGATALNVGVMFGLTVIVNDAVVAH